MYIYMRHFKLFPPRSKAEGWQTEAELAEVPKGSVCHLRVPRQLNNGSKAKS